MIYAIDIVNLLQNLTDKMIELKTRPRNITLRECVAIEKSAWDWINALGLGNNPYMKELKKEIESIEKDIIYKPLNISQSQMAAYIMRCDNVQQVLHLQSAYASVVTVKRHITDRQRIKAALA
jgi:hypothetical protein